MGAVGLLAGCTGSDGGDGGGGDGGDGSDGGDGGDGGGGDGGDGGGDGDAGTDFPQNPIENIITYGTGGGYDSIVRLVAPWLGDELGVEVRPVNVEGAGGRIGSEQFYSADPDGYTIILENQDARTIEQVHPDVDPDYDLTEYTYLAQYAQDIRGIGVARRTGVENFADYVEAVQNRELRIYSSGPGSGHVIPPALLGEISGLYDAEDITSQAVHYDGRGEAYQGVLSGDVDMQSGTYHSVLPYTPANDGELKMILSFNLGDEPPLPDQTPDCETLTTAELPDGSVGLPNAEQIEAAVTGRRMYAAPPETPDDRAGILSDALGNVLTNDEFVAEAEEAGRPVTYLGPEDARDAAMGMIETWEESPEFVEKIYY